MRTKSNREKDLIQPVRRTNPRQMLAPDGTPDYPPVELPPIEITANRPVIDAITMRRGVPGSGVSGDQTDLSPMRVQRLDPMTMREGAENGLFESAVPRGVEMDPSDAFRHGLMRPFADRPVQGPAGVAMGDLATTNRIQNALADARDKDDWNMSTAAGRAMGDTLDATREARWGQGGPTSGAKFATVEGGNAGGRFANRERERVVLPMEERGGTRDRAIAILNQRQRVAEANATPQAVASPGAGVAMFDVKSGKWQFGGKDDGTASSPAGLNTLADNDLLAGLSKYGKPKQLTPKELDPISAIRLEKATPEERTSILNPPWTDDNQRAHNLYLAEAKRRGLVSEEPRAATPTTPSTSGYQPGAERTINGVRYVRSADGKWTPSR